MLQLVKKSRGAGRTFWEQHGGGMLLNAHTFEANFLPLIASWVKKKIDATKYILVNTHTQFFN